ncbi:hypothetical protein HY523_02680 [Candidatus Berkelbacteria bacterium]|nr:hypothetical protein [Candidatus Berkelbacteria bacterium]
MNKVALGVIAVVVLGGLAYAGQSLYQKGSTRGGERLAEEIIEQASDGRVNFSANDSSFSVTNEDGTASATYGSNVSLPANFPSDVPTPQGASLVSVYGGTEGGKESFALVYNATGSVNQITTAYQNQLIAAGFSVENSGSASSSGSTVSGFTATKGSTSVNAAITSDGTTTNLTLTVIHE